MNPVNKVWCLSRLCWRQCGGWFQFWLTLLLVAFQLLFPKPTPPSYDHRTYPDNMICESLTVRVIRSLCYERVIAIDDCRDSECAVQVGSAVSRVSRGKRCLHNARPGNVLLELTTDLIACAQEKADLLVIFSHGNGCDMGQMAETM